MLVKTTYRSFIIAIAAIILAITCIAPLAIAQESNSNGQGFSLQVTPSPLVATVKPGEKSNLELRIRNTNTDTQNLKMGMRAFSINDQTGEVDLGNEASSEVTEFIGFSQPEFTLKAGEIINQEIIIDTPQSAGFTYSFAITVSNQKAPRQTDGGATIEGSVAIFTLLNVEREGAIRKFDLSEFSTKKRVYEYLPASFDIRLKNSGNTIIQPKGNLFIQRKSNDSEPIATLPLNAAGGYILPNSSRILNTNWSEGFPRYETKTDSNGKQHEKLVWNWNKLSDLRIGKYTAKVVAVYDDGQRDVPVVTEISFWVVPWRILGVFTLILALILVGAYTLLRRSTDVIKHRNKTSNDKKQD